MSTQVIELEGFEIELASELYCDRGGDHRELVDRARTDRRRLGHNVDESAVLCVRCMKAMRAESVMPGRLVAGLWTLNPDTGVRIAPRQPVLETSEHENSRSEGSLLLLKKHTVFAGSLLKLRGHPIG